MELACLTRFVNEDEGTLRKCRKVLTCMAPADMEIWRLWLRGRLPVV